jgi:response regulator of citrate/malate metabolism
MGQEDIIRFLKGNQPKWFNAKEIAKAVQASNTSVNRCLGSLRKHREVLCRDIKVEFLNHSKYVPFYSYKG